MATVLPDPIVPGASAPPSESDDSVLTPDVDPEARATPAAPAAAEPNLARTTAALAGRGGRSLGVTVLTVLALLYTLYFAREFLVPVAFAVLLNFLFSPVVRALARVRIPPQFGAAIVLAALLTALGAGVYELSGPVQTWAAKTPATFAAAQAKLWKLARPFERVARTAEQVTTAASASSPGTQKPPSVVVQGPSVLSRIFGTTQRLLAGILEVVILLYFLLAAGDLFLQKLIKILPDVRDKRTAVRVARETESSISTYLLTSAAVNTGEGIVVAGAMYLWGMPNPALWGALVALLEFIPYLGALTMTAILGVAALTTFDNVAYALLIPLSFLTINLVQANLVSPMLLGHRLALNPVAIFVGLAFWFWVWGVPGAFIAVPMLAAFKILCDHVKALAAVGEFLGQRDEDERRRMVR